MGSHCQISVHIIFGLKKHKKFITNDMRSFIAGIINNNKGKTIEIGGTSDHVHILCLMPKEMSISAFVRTIKSNSSRWYNQKGFGKMQWQVGYAAFSVSKTNITRVQTYIQNQEEHHKQMTFQEEMMKYLDDPVLIAQWKKWVFEDSEDG